MLRRVLVSLCVIALLASAAGYAATTGRLNGTVKDNDGLALPGVTVQITSVNLMGSQVAITGGDGTFSFSALPVGMYTVEASLVGFQGATGEVRVSLDRTGSVAFILVAEQFADEIIVEATVPVVDTAQVNTQQVFDQDFLQNAAIGATGRSYQNIISQAAGTGGGSNANVFGGMMTDNNYLIDGVSTTDPVTQTFGTNFNYDAIQEVSVQTGGYEAELGQATGGIVNLVTKSGGNDFSGSLDLRYRDQDFIEDGDHFDGDGQDNSFEDYSMTLGGPILRDKLWFFVAYEFVKTKSQGENVQFPRIYEGSNYMAKASWQITDGNRAVFRYSGDPAEIPGANGSQFVEPSASYTQEQGGEIWGFELNSVLSDSLLLNLKGGIVRGALDGGPSNGTQHESSHYNSQTLILSNNYWSSSRSDRDRDEFGAHMSWFVDDLAGSHEFKFGAEISDQSWSQWSWDNGAGNIYDIGGPGVAFDDINGDGYYNDYVSVTEPGIGEIPGYDADGSFNQAALDIRRTVETTGDVTTFFVQDTWRPSPNLTIKPGVRYDNVVLVNAAGEQGADMDRWQPRVGMAWDISGNAKYVARASWGRFMDPTALTVLNYANGLTEITHSYDTMEMLCNAGFPCDREFLEGLFGTEAIDWTNGEGIDYVLFDTHGGALQSEPSETIDQAGFGHLEAPYADQLILAFEMQVAPETSFEITYVDKETKSIIEDSCSNNDWVWDSSVPAPDLDDSSTWTTNAGCTQYIIGNHNYLYREYKAFIGKFETRGDWWHGLFSWTHSDSKGNNETDSRWSYSRQTVDFFPVNFVNIDGYLGDHKKDRLKASGYVLLPGSWTIGLDTYWESAGHITSKSSCQSYLGASPEALEYYGIGPEAQEYCAISGLYPLYDIFHEPRGETETKSIWNADLSVTKAFTVGPTDMSLIFSVYNLFGRELDSTFNSRAFRVTSEESGLGEPVYENGPDNDPTYYVPIGKPLSYRYPRRYELGFRLTF
ncbi:MAG: TonB-dependent receptor [Acidobacteriota bacterium]